jgi:cytochrome oxidase assembly protein ShyY1
MHQSYALQWYTLAGLSVVMFLVLSVRRAPPAV